MNINRIINKQYYIEINGNPEEYIIQHDFHKIYNIQEFELHFHAGMYAEYETLDEYIPAINEFQKYVMQNIKLLDKFTPPDLYFYYFFSTRKANTLGKTVAFPCIKGFIFSNSNIPVENIWKMNKGMERFGGKIKILRKIETIDFEKDFIKYKKQIIDRNIKNNRYHSFLFFCNNINYQCSKGEKECINILTKSPYVKKIIPQYVFQNCVYINPLPFDFYVQLQNDDYFILEYHGQQHYKPIKFWDGLDNNGYIERKNRDLIKQNYCEKFDIKLLIIPYWDFDNISSIITNYINNLLPQKQTNIINKNKHNKPDLSKQKTILDFL